MYLDINCLFTHYEEKFSDCSELSFEQFIDGSLGEAPHLPPVGEERGPGEEEAEDVEAEQEADHQVEVEELGAPTEGGLGLVKQPAAAVPHPGQHGAALQVAAGFCITISLISRSGYFDAETIK